MKLIGSTPAPTSARCVSSWPRRSWTTSLCTEDVWAADTTIRESNPLGKVPCLVMEGGEALFDSRVIVEYLDTCPRWAS
jgi:glutathione S-transferase